MILPGWISISQFPRLNLPCSLLFPSSSPVLPPLILYQLFTTFTPFFQTLPSFDNATSIKMVMLTRLFTSALLFSATAYAAPIEKRIAQTIADSTTAWVKACVRISPSTYPPILSEFFFIYRLLPVVPINANQSPKPRSCRS